MKGKFSARRLWVQVLAALANNAYLPGLLQGRLYSGSGKMLCSPGLNCYSCPASVLSCPVGSIQTLAAAPSTAFPLYIAGFTGLVGLNTGRYACGWLCPFGLLQELIYRLPGPKYRIIRPLRHTKYLVLLVFVILMPLLWLGPSGYGTAAFCRLLCPAGTLEAGLPFVWYYERLMDQAGILFAAKTALLLLIAGSAVFFFRPFCRVLCPLGAIYAPFNRISLLRLQVDAECCIQCGICSDVCRMDIEVYKEPNSLECIRCYECIEACPQGSIKWSYRLS